MHSNGAAAPRLTPMRGLRMEMVAVSSALNLLSLALPIVILPPISQMNSLIDALRWRLCYKNQYVEE
ncbi:MAG: hypothetical protein QF512_21035, partial [Alphaproteobacteria bacterium]|nr:hypothetical protein [Alphaproteobacteria bacterium]